MDQFQTKILALLKARWISAPGLDDQAMLDQILPIAQENIVLNLLHDFCSPEDQNLFRDAYISAPDIFDPMEFLENRIESFDERFNEYFEKWFAEFESKLQ